MPNQRVADDAHQAVLELSPMSVELQDTAQAVDRSYQTKLRKQHNGYAASLVQRAPFVPDEHWTGLFCLAKRLYIPDSLAVRRGRVCDDDDQHGQERASTHMCATATRVTT